MGPSLVETLQIEVTDQGVATYRFQLEEHLQESQQHRLVPGVPAVPGEPLSESAPDEWFAQAERKARASLTEKACEEMGHQRMTQPPVVEACGPETTNVGKPWTAYVKRPKTCHTCSGQGDIPCSRCGAEGRVHCHSCRGRGKVDCSYCDGTSWARCIACSGSNCTFCLGTGSSSCTRCVTGEVTCDDCQGVGARLCIDCLGEQTLKCEVCEGHKMSTELSTFKVDLQQRLTLLPSQVVPSALKAHLLEMTRNPTLSKEATLRALGNVEGTWQTTRRSTFEVECAYAVGMARSGDLVVPLTWMGSENKLMALDKVATSLLPVALEAAQPRRVSFWSLGYPGYVAERLQQLLATAPAKASVAEAHSNRLSDSERRAQAFVNRVRVNAGLAPEKPERSANFSKEPWYVLVRRLRRHLILRGLGPMAVLTALVFSMVGFYPFTVCSPLVTSGSWRGVDVMVLALIAASTLSLGNLVLARRKGLQVLRAAGNDHLVELAPGHATGTASSYMVAGLALVGALLLLLVRMYCR